MVVTLRLNHWKSAAGVGLGAYAAWSVACSIYVLFLPWPPRILPAAILAVAGILAVPAPEHQLSFSVFTVAAVSHALLGLWAALMVVAAHIFAGSLGVAAFAAYALTQVALPLVAIGCAKRLRESCEGKVHYPWRGAG
jgi:hypothetical protein